MAFQLKPCDHDFFKYFNESSQAICEGTRILKDFLNNGGEGGTQLELLAQVEAKGDALFSDLINRLDSSFAAPFEREDIYQLARQLNVVLTEIHDIMEMMVLYKPDRLKDSYIQNLVEVLKQAATEIKNGVGDLSSIKHNYDKILKACDTIKEFEHKGDTLYRRGIALLFDNVTDAIELIKWKEIFEHLEIALDQCEDVSNVIKGVAVKYA